MQQHGSKYFFPADPHPPPSPWGIGSKCQISTFSEHRHVAFQINGNVGMQQSTAPAPTGLENSTYLLGFTCALSCRASENFDISSDFYSIYIYIYIYANTL